MRIFVDLDGVLADWEGAVSKIFGKHHSEVKGHVLWPFIAKSKTFWVDLEKLPDADILWDNIKNHDIKILTGCPKSSFENAKNQKLSWCKEHFPDAEVITCLAKDKQLHIVESGDILIDDNQSNCKRWEEAGGISILHIGAIDTLEKLSKLS